jgi:hypothetical protein
VIPMLRRIACWVARWKILIGILTSCTVSKPFFSVHKVLLRNICVSLIHCCTSGHTQDINNQVEMYVRSNKQGEIEEVERKVIFSNVSLFISDSSTSSNLFVFLL